MVNVRPSQGCNTCIQRKVKCDQQKPVCCNCFRLGVECTGYGKRKRGIRFKDQPDSTCPSRPKPQCEGATRRQKGDLAKKLYFSYEYSEQQIVNHAICFFFNNFVSLGRDFSSSRGFIENIIPIYTQARQTSPISLAVSAVSTSLFSLWNKDGKTRDIAAKYLGTALNRLHDSLNDSTERQQDGILMASILLQLHESMNALRESRTVIPVHHNGAISLIRDRGIQSFELETSKYLLLYVHNSEICCAIQDGRHVNTEIECWSQCDNMPSNPSLELAKLGVHVANVQADFIEFSQNTKCRTPLNTDLSHIATLYQKAMDLERELFSWSQALPEYWRPLKLKPTSQQIPIYENICEIYPSIHKSSIWNTWRCYSLMVINIIQAYDQIEIEISGQLHNIQTSNLFQRVQMLVDSICYSVPFHLGNRFGEGRILEMSDSRLEFPGYHDLKPAEMSHLGFPEDFTFLPRDQHIRHALAQGAFHIASHLSQLVTLLSGRFGQLLMSALRDGQVDWIHSQLLRVVTLLGMPHINHTNSDISLEAIRSFSGNTTTTQARLMALSIRQGLKFTGI